jgi:DNA repair exonuclease SbcCD nuclease subunit
MSHSPFRFLHASDFHLEQPLTGLADVPEHLRELILDAPYSSAAKVFETAILDGVAYVVLSGDIVEPLLAGPRGLLFLVEQFEKLAAKGIEVFWAGGAVDPPDAWPSALALPNNVHVFPSGRVDEYLIRRDGVPVARVLGTSREHGQNLRTGEFRPDPSGLFTVAVAYGDVDPAMQTRGIHYWALGGRHERLSPGGREGSTPGQTIVHYCGTPQGRHPGDTGVRGCTLVQVDEQNQTRTSVLPCDVVRWQTEQIVLEKEMTNQELESRMRDRLHLLREVSPQMNLLVSWVLSGESNLAHELQRGRLAADLLDGLRGDFGFQSPVMWSLGMEMDFAPGVPADWFEQETIRGDFLRAIEQLRMNPGEPLGIEDYLPESYRAGTLATALENEENAVRRHVLNEATQLGLELLGGAEE